MVGGNGRVMVHAPVSSAKQDLVKVTANSWVFLSECLLEHCDVTSSSSYACVVYICVNQVYQNEGFT